MTANKSLVTFVLEIADSVRAKFLWDSYRDVLLHAQYPERHGVIVHNMREGDCLAALRTLESKENNQAISEIIFNFSADVGVRLEHVPPGTVIETTKNDMVGVVLRNDSVDLPSKEVVLLNTGETVVLGNETLVKIVKVTK